MKQNGTEFSVKRWNIGEVTIARIIENEPPCCG
jgi:hypothetical protein